MARMRLLSGIAIASFLLTFTYILVNSSSTSIFTTNVFSKQSDGILLLATGDIMVHDTQLESAYRSDRKEYDFTEWFTEIEPYLHEADLVVANLETTLSGADMQYTGYPAFNSPETLAYNLKKAGFDLVSTANNHCLDRGEKGVLRTLEHLEKAGLNFYGTARSQEERDNFLSIKKNGITVVFLAYTYGTNGIPVPEGKEYLVNMIYENFIKADIQKARENSDLVVVSLHWGLEYNREPHPEQQILAEKIISWGADLIVGSHPHVLQPVEFIKTSSGRKGVVINSLGNLIADQIIPYTDSGIMVRLRYVRGKEGVELAEITGVPTWIHRFYKDGRLAFRVLPVADAMYSYKRGEDPYLTVYNYSHLQKVWEETTNHVWLTTYSIKMKYLHTATTLKKWFLWLY